MNTKLQEAERGRQEAERGRQEAERGRQEAERGRQEAEAWAQGRTAQILDANRKREKDQLKREETEAENARLRQMLKSADGMSE